MYGRSTLLWVLSPHVLTSVLALPSPIAHPQDTTSNTDNLSVQPNFGGGRADDCGAGPIKLDADTWNANKMDDLIQSVWDSGNGNSKFDFHQAFSDKYSVDLYCKNIFTNCEGDPESCSDLKGSTEEKTQGWLGIKAILSVQDMYLQIEKATTANNGAKAAIADLLEKTSKRTIHRDAFSRAAVNIFGAVAGVLAGGPLGAVIGGLGPVTATFANDVIADNRKEGPDWDFAKIFDRWEDMKLFSLQTINLAHGAAFTNGQARGRSGPKLPDMLKGGRFAGSSYPEAYEQSENSLLSLVERVTFSKTMESLWREQYNAFYLYVPGIIESCHGWHGNTGRGDEMRYCADDGMYIMMGINPDNDDAMNSPPGAGTSDVASYGGYNISLADLHQSSVKTYESHGLVHSGIPYFMEDIFEAWRNSPDNRIFAQPGFFYLPVCQIGAESWQQSDRASKNSPPCDCLTATDKWENKFIEQATPTVQKWITDHCS